MKNFPFGLPGVLVAALALGVAGDWLFWVGPCGINVTLWLGAVLGVILYAQRAPDRPRETTARITLGAAIFFTILYSWRDADPLKPLLILVIGVSCGLSAAAAFGRSLRIALVHEYVLDGIYLAFSSLAVPPRLLRDARQEMQSKGRPYLAIALSCLWGAVIAAPALLVFGALFASADALFERFVVETFDFDLETVIAHSFWVVFYTFAATAAWGLHLDGTACTRAPREVSDTSTSWGAIEINVALGLITLLFLSFVAIQLPYFFGGHERVLEEAGLSYADYARSGFFELAWVAVIALGLLLVSAGLIQGASPAARHLYKATSGVLIACVAVIIASALHRMNLYIEMYGLTRLRLYTALFMLWMAAVFLWLYFTIYRDRVRSFAWGFLLSGYAATLILLALNPDALVARTNLARAAAGKSIDMRYIDVLSADAFPTLVRAVPALDDQNAAALNGLLTTRGSELVQRPLRTWTLGLQRAYAALTHLKPESPTRQSGNP